MGKDVDGSGAWAPFSCMVPEKVDERRRTHTLLPRPPRPPRPLALPASAGGALALVAARLRTEGPNTLVFKTRSRLLNTSLDGHEKRRSHVMKRTKGRR